MKARANFFHGVTAKNDPRFKGKMVREIINFPPNVTESFDTEKINAMSFEEWVKKEILKYTDDELIPGIVQGYLEGKEIDSQELGRTLKPFIGQEHTIEFVSNLWNLLLDAQSNELGIPTAFLEQSKRDIEEKTKQVSAVRELIQKSSSSSSSSSSDNEADPKNLEHVDFGFPTKIEESIIESNNTNQNFKSQKYQQSYIRPQKYQNTIKNQKGESNNSNDNKWKGGSWTKDGFFKFRRVDGGTDDERDSDDDKPPQFEENHNFNPSDAFNNDQSYGSNYSNNGGFENKRKRKVQNYSSGSYSRYSEYSNYSDYGSYSSNYSSYGYSSSTDSSDENHKSKSRRGKRSKDRKNRHQRKNKRHTHSYSYSSSSTSTPSSPTEPRQLQFNDDNISQEEPSAQTPQVKKPIITFTKTHSYSSSEDDEYSQRRIKEKESRRHHKNPIGHHKRRRH